MTDGTGRVFVVGGSESVRGELGRHLDVPIAEGMPPELRPGDLVVLDATADAGEMPFGNAFSACRSVKRSRGVRVFVLVAHDDPYGVEIARFCMADGALRIGANGALLDVDRLGEQLAPHRPRASTDDLLARLEADLRADSARQRSAIQRILAQSDEPSFLDRLTDADTGLFDGPYVAFKLDEEMKRASRFHQPLSLLLVDCGGDEWPQDDALRRALLAEVASVFLNNCRDIDVLARFTETVFLCLLPGTGSDGALSLARRILGELRNRELEGGRRLSPAIGIATVPHPELPDRRSLLARAEACASMARDHGDGGRICRIVGAGDVELDPE